jgi:hypothetical protein
MNWLRVGVGRCDITPAPGTPQGGWGAQTHQRGTTADLPLYVTALVVEDSNEIAAIIDVDNCGFETEWTLGVIRHVSTLTAIPAPNIRLSYSHTHSGTNNYRLTTISEGRDMIVRYMDDLPNNIAGAVLQAQKGLKPARVAAKRGHCEINVNRRVTFPGGYAVGRNWDGPVDHTVNVVRFDDLSQQPIATIVHYSCHPTVMAWQNEVFTPDYPGMVRQVVEREIGGRCLFLQGAAGDIGPRRGFTGDLRVYRKLGARLGLEASSVAASIETLPHRERFVGIQASGAPIAIYDDEPAEPGKPILKVISRPIPLPLKPVPPLIELEADAQQKGEALNQARRSRATAELIRASTTAVAQADDRLTTARVNAGNTHTNWSLMGIRIGDIAFLSMPGEPLTDINRSIVEKSPFPYTLFSGYSNGGFGYLPPAHVYGEGGYEVEASPFASEAGEVVTTGALSLLQELWAFHE